VIRLSDFGRGPHLQLRKGPRISLSWKLHFTGMRLFPQSQTLKSSTHTLQSTIVNHPNSCSNNISDPVRPAFVPLSLHFAGVHPLPLFNNLPSTIIISSRDPLVATPLSCIYSWARQPAAIPTFHLPHTRSIAIGSGTFSSSLKSIPYHISVPLPLRLIPGLRSDSCASPHR
jgi:hypothetical protein